MVAYCSTPAVLTLTLGASTLDLMDQANGFRVNEVELAFPDVREDIDLKADQRGANDYTRLFGSRAVTITGSIVPSAAGSRQKSLHVLVPFIDPRARPVLTYQFDADAKPRQLTLRAAALSAPFNSPQVSAFQLGFKAADPVAYDPTVNTAIAYSYRGQGGRAYNLNFNRVYPPSQGGASLPTNNGDVTVYPVLHLYGPASNIVVGENIFYTPTRQNITLIFKTGFSLSAGDRLDIDCKARTATLNDPSVNVYGQLGWNASGLWPYMPPGIQTGFTLGADNATTSTQLQVVWQDGYLL